MAGAVPRFSPIKDYPMKISFWKRLAIYFVLSIIVMALMSFFADDSDAQTNAEWENRASTLDVNAQPTAFWRQ